MTMHIDETSVEDSRPREGFTIQHGTQVYHLASGTRNVMINGNLYVAFPIGRGEYGAAFVGGNQQELEIRLPVSHPFTRRYFQNTIPPKSISVAGYRKQLRSGGSERFWFGELTSCTIEDDVASFRIPALSADALERVVPHFTVSRQCPYILYESGCDVNRNSHRVVTTVAAVDGAEVTLTSAGGNPDNWARDGELVHLASGERMTIYAHVGNVVTMQFLIAELKVGDTVHVFAGCEHTVEHCLSQFNNKDNFGGAPQLPRGSLFVPNGYGVVVQE